MIMSGKNQADERKRITDDVSKVHTTISKPEWGRNSGTNLREICLLLMVISGMEVT